MENCYVYKWTHKPSLRWYVGSRTSKHSRLDDGYICSSKIVKPMIKAHPEDWMRSIVAIGDAKSMRMLETEILTAIDAKNDERSFNKHNQDLKFVCSGHSPETIEKIKKNHAFAGRKRPEHAIKMMGRKRTEEELERLSNSLKGRKFSDAHLQKFKEAKSIGEYHTPKGIFISSRDAAKAYGCSKTVILHRCFGWYSKLRDKWYPAADGWSFVRKDEV